MRSRLDWDAHVSKLRRENAFERFYRMNEATFDCLLRFMTPKLRSGLSTYGNSAILPEIYLHCALRFLAGGTYLDIRDKAEISTASFYRIFWQAACAILDAPELALQLPSVDELPLCAEQFAALSSNAANHPPLFTGCVGAIDGMLQRIRTPDKRDTKAARHYYFGHYSTMGVNCQAMCDHLCRFTYFGVVAPGGANDVRAYQSSLLKDWVDNLPPRFYVVADNAYILSEHLLSPFYGADKRDEHKDSFNFYLSQL